jgi:hypothetical protein
LWVLAGLLIVLKPGTAPAIWYDEGWNLTVARNWVELGHYGPLLNGAPVPPDMISTGFPGIMPIALSFRLFGVGLWQARLPGMLISAAALLLIYHLANRLGGRSAALGTLAFLLLACGDAVHPVANGRNALGEMPAMLFLLAGYACFLSAWRGRPWLHALAAICWGLAMMTKTQVIPFLTLALLVPWSVMLYRRSWKSAAVLTAVSVGSFAVLQLLILVQKQMLNDPAPPQTHIGLWYYFAAVVPVLRIRLTALTFVLIFAPLAVLGLGYAAWEYLKGRRAADMESAPGTVRLSLFVLSGSWLAWYVLLAQWWPRYLFPAVFLSSVFAVTLLQRVYAQLRTPLERLGRPRGLVAGLRRKALTLLFVFLLGWAVFIACVGLYRSYVKWADKSVLETASFLNTQTPPDALIETSEAELYFLLNRRYHYGSVEEGSQVIRHKLVSEDTVADYNPLAADPDYLVVGNFGREYGVYFAYSGTGDFEHLATIGRYDIYQRLR